MFRGIYTGVSAMLVQEKMLDVAGNNLANVDTTGFKERVAVNQSFPEVLMDRVERYSIVDDVLNDKLDDGRFSPFVRGRIPINSMSLTNVMSETVMSTHPGVVQVTDNPFDVLIDGPGFFAVERGGETYYTRAGNFQRSPDGFLTTHEGEFVLGTGGRIELPEGSRYYVDGAGAIFVDEELAGQLQVVNFANPTYLRHVGRSLLAETAGSGEPEEVEIPIIVGGALERSNVEVVLEMVRMIEANRAYEASGRAVTIQDELSGRLCTSVGKPS